MALNRVDLGIQYFPQFAADRAIANAQIYIGLPNLDPAVLANQIQAYVVQENGTQVPVPQPIRTGAGGVPTYNGSPVQIGVAEAQYSLKALSSTGSQIYYQPDNTDLAIASASQITYTYPDGTQKTVQDLAGDTGADGIGYTPEGTGAVFATAQDKLRKDLRSVIDFMTDAQRADAYSMNPVLDHTAALNAAFTACSTVFIPEFCVIRITSLVIIPTGKNLIGASRYTSQILVGADTDGIRAGVQNIVDNLRIKGGSNVSASKILFLWRDDNCLRSMFSRLIIGGLGTSLGDATNTRCPAMGMRSGNAFLNSVRDVYIFNCGIGWDNYSSTNGRLNACEINNVEVHSCGLGARLKVLNGVTFNNFIAENNDQEGLIMSSCRGVTMNSPYFEVNNQLNTGLYKAEFIIKADGLNGGSADVGGSVQINDPYMSPGTNAVVGLQIEQQRLAFLNGGHFINFTGKPNTIIIDAPGQATNFFINSGVAPVFNANLIVGPYTQTGATPLGFVSPRFRTRNGQTATLGIGNSAVLFTPVVGESGILTVQATNNNSAFRWVGTIQRFTTAINVVTLDSSNISVTDLAGAVNLTQTGGGAVAFVWSYIRTQ